ncbi:MAG: AbrB/MazE/SpoVT family DNA-binding domain-containing protein [bacterium]|nr:AbrB/MazE/SpoVT family DNA-binding domain-containing protein [bacterium]
MLATLTKQGDQMLLPIESELLEQLHIDSDAPLNIEAAGDVSIVSPVRDDARRKKLQKTLKKVNQRYGRRMLKRLAE